MNLTVNHIPENWQPFNELSFKKWLIFKIKNVNYNNYDRN